MAPKTFFSRKSDDSDDSNSDDGFENKRLKLDGSDDEYSDIGSSSEKDEYEKEEENQKDDEKEERIHDAENTRYDDDDDKSSYNSSFGSDDSDEDEEDDEENDEENDEFKIFKNIVDNREPVPEPITSTNFIFALGCHPKSPILAFGDISGLLSVWKYDENTLKTSELSSRKVHGAAIRSLCYSESGNYIVTSSSDKSIMVHDSETGKVFLRKKDAHSSAVNVISVLDDNLLATGDDKGIVKIWDTREKKMIRKYKENVDYITDFTYVDEKKTLLTTSGDGCLSIFDIRHNKPIAVSANQDEDLLSVCVIKNMTKAAVGTSEGSLLFFNWGDWGDSTDRFTELQHSGSIDSIVQTDDTQIILGSSDGGIRKIDLFPHKLQGILGHHCAEGIENITNTYDEKYIVSSGHDYTLKFWSTK